MPTQKIKTITLRFLGLIQKHTKTDMVYLARNSFWTTATRISGALLSFVLAVCFANLLPESVFGNYKFILSLAAVASAFSLTGLHLAIIRDVARGTVGLLRTSFFVQLKWSVGVLVASLCMAGYYAFAGNMELASACLLMGIFLPITAAAKMYSPFLEGKKDYTRLSQYSIATTVAYTATLATAIFLTHNLLILIFLYFASQAICSLIFFLTSLKFDPINSAHPHKTVKFGKDLSFLNILSTLAGQLDKILVYHYLGAAQLATYALALVPASQVGTGLKQFAQLAYPKYSAKSLPEIRSTIYHKMALFSVPIIITVVLYIVLAPFVFKVFFPKYLEAVAYSQIAMLSVLFLQKKLITYTLLAHAPKKTLYRMSIWASVSKIGLLLLLLPLYGIWGAIATELISQGIGLVMTVVTLNRLSRAQQNV